MDIEKLLTEKLDSLKENQEKAIEHLEDELEKVKSDKELSEKEKTEFVNQINKLQGTIKTLDEIVKRQGETLENIQKSGDVETTLEEDIKKWYGNINEYLKSPSGRSEILKLKSDKILERKKYSITGDHTGDILISRQSKVVSDSYDTGRHIRTAIVISTIDQISLTYLQISNWTPGIDWIGEIDPANDFNFDTKEVTTHVRRVSGYTDLSGNMLKSMPYVLSHIENTLPDRLLDKEDRQLLFGDGTGNNLEGIATQAIKFELQNKTYNAGDIASIESYQNGDWTLVTFAAAHELTPDYIITFSNTANYHGEYSCNIISDNKIVLQKSYIAESTATWTATAIHSLKGAMPNANKVDAINAAASYITGNKFRPSAVVINTQDFTVIKSLKGNDGQYMVRWDNGIPYFDDLMIIATSHMPAGSFLVGDFSNRNIMLYNYEDLAIEFLRDADLAIRNLIRLYITEQVMLTVYNPFAFVYTTYNEVLSQIS